MIRSFQRLIGNKDQPTSPVFMLSVVIFFWAVFDCIVTYLTPILIESKGFSSSMIGLIIGSSSITGAAFDFILCKTFKKTNYRRIFLLMFALCMIYPLVLWGANSIWIFLIAMAIWGVYYDLYGFGVFNFVSRYVKVEDHSASFGVIQIFRACGSVIAPLIIDFVIVESIDWKSYTTAWIFLSIGLLVFIAMIFGTRKRLQVDNFPDVQPRRKNLFIELHLWKKLEKLLFPVLILTAYLFFIDAFFWTLAPLYAEKSSLAQFGGLFLTAYSLPQLVVGWFITPLTKRFGKKRSAYFSLFVGSIILTTFFLIQNPYLAIIVVFLSSCFLSMALPIINSSYADYICDAPQVEGEIEGLEDMAFNIGYVLGPISAGVLADVFGMQPAFSILGVFGAILAVFLLIKSPKYIIIKVKKSEL